MTYNSRDPYGWCSQIIEKLTKEKDEEIERLKRELSLFKEKGEE